MKKLFQNIRVYEPNKLIETMLNAEDGTIFVLGEKVKPNPEGDHSVEIIMAQIKRAKD